ncbi:alpha/beta fold hydrolase [Natronosalvus caseinilyticus]|uniref:alpha/beta fold hydrolase n=1 Tax=Natronosalvus caseinilyticus TaxID=2953747 RepID=UPI0028AE0E95|nr:alpha/beta hydrolase [Natronosalvus caseinilyticus]
MKLRSALGVAAGTVGLTALGNRLLASRAGPLENPVPGVERTYHWRGMDVCYTVAGEPDAPDMVLVHGIHAAASGQEFADVVDELADTYRVTVVDLPGFGRSDRPPLVYSPELYAEFLEEFLHDQTETPIVVASSLSASFAVDAASEVDLERLILICPLADTTERRPWIRTLFRTPLVGTALFNVLVSKPSTRYFYERDGFYDADRIDPESLEYAWQSAHQPGAKYAPASFVAGTLDPDSDFDLATELAALEVPTTLVWGRDAELVPLRDGRELADAADLDLVVIDYATQMPHAEHPEKFLEYVSAELPRTDS